MVEDTKRRLKLGIIKVLWGSVLMFNAHLYDASCKNVQVMSYWIQLWVYKLCHALVSVIIQESCISKWLVS